MQSFKKPSRSVKHVALITGVTGAALIGAVAVGGAAFADGPSAPSPSSSSSASAPQAPGAQNGQTPQAPGTQGGQTPQAPAAPGKGGSSATPAQPKPHIGGEVQSVSGSTVTVKDHDGFTRTIQLGSDVTVTKDGSKSDTSAITEGVHIEATGSVDSNGTTLDATQVQIGRPAGPGEGGPAAGGPASGPMGGPAGKGQLPTRPSGGAAPQAPGQQSGSQQSGSQQGGSQQGGSQQQSIPTPSNSAPVQGS